MLWELSENVPSGFVAVVPTVIQRLAERHWTVTRSTSQGLHWSSTVSVPETICCLTLVDGFHYRHSVIAGENLGTSVANWELARYFLPTDGSRD